MKNYIQKGVTLTVPAPAGGVLSGQLVVIGKIVGVAAFNAPEAESVEVQTEGVFELPKVTTDVVTVGESLYWDAGAGKLTDTPGSGSKPLVGYAVAAAGNGAIAVQARLVPTLQAGPA